MQNFYMHEKHKRIPKRKNEQRTEENVFFCYRLRSVLAAVAAVLMQIAEVNIFHFVHLSFRFCNIFFLAIILVQILFSFFFLTFRHHSTSV